MVRVIQSWDDGLVDDIRLAAMLRRHGAKAAFCLNPGLCRDERSFGWIHESREVWRLGLHELVEVYDGFEIGSHSLTHPRLTDLSPDRLRREVRQSRIMLENIFQRPVLGFAYPFNAYDPSVISAVRSAGYLWARGNGNRTEEATFPPADPLAFDPSCHFLDPDFWGKYERQRDAEGVFFFWGHSCELLDETMWENLERMTEGIASDPAARWSFTADLFRGEKYGSSP